MAMNYFEIAGMILGALLTAAAFALNLYSLLRGRRIFRGPRACRLKYL